ncbi:DUF3152 domain-containing protein [Streptomyces diacarni]|uniref:DUF3152 domain-containing protein n=1 Tax=Streptomyces diacarni TaxID=2800381 RepID=A0A367EQQ2_9ACTN|nr:DUF3152 domain-containing protein [Streptomyces diacarni]RCG19520.1 DUF3152 domain-containing protein [Streptomyces diacarni]
MGRHSRKGKAGTARGQQRSGIPERQADAGRAAARSRDAGAPGRADAAGWERDVTAPYPAEGAPAARPGPHGTPAHGVPGHVDEPTRGGHPQFGEPYRHGPGGAHGYGLPHGQGQGRSQGRGQAQNPWRSQGPEQQRGGPHGPRQDYLDAFDDAVFTHRAAGAPGASAPADARQRPAGASGTPRAPHRAAGPAAPGPPAPQATADAPPADDEPRGDRTAGPAQSRPRRQRTGGRARTYTGIAAAAITTVLAIVIAAQVAGGEHSSGQSDDGANTGERAPGGTAGQDDRADRGTRPTPGAPGNGSASYDAKMAHVYPLADDLEGTDKFTAVPGHEKGSGKGEVIRYRVDVEKKLPLDGELFAKAVHKTLNDERSWAHDGKRSFERVSSGKAKFVITLATPKTTDLWCAKSGLDTSEQKVSCDSAATERIMINGYRWARGAKTFGPGQMHAYRQMLINHEVGHRLGHDHVGCPGDGEPAPVMMQQTKYLTTQGKTCRPNAWPHPRG